MALNIRAISFQGYHMSKTNRGPILNPNNTFVGTGFEATTDYYFYNASLRTLHTQFAALFSELQVSIGKNGNPNQQTRYMTVPIKVASMDRVVASIFSKNVQNVPIRLPALATQMVSMEIDDDRISGLNQVSRKTVFPLGAAWPNQGKVIYKVKPMPFRVTYELSIITRNQQNHDEILEQILTLFTPDVMIQLSDDVNDWSSINTVKLTNINLETPYMSADTDQRLITTVLQFATTAYISAPVNIRENYIKKVKLKMSTGSVSRKMDEYYIDDGDDTEGYETIIDVEKMNIPPH